ncbi:MAG: glycosyltransferase [Paludibacteraceae bacterium]|nr:glycosyltransferase [Paludibacteraceae bacterium]
MSNPKLSIIVPIYNVEPYLRKCVDSLLAQDLPKDEYEIILVDDGSPDGCPAICDEYASQYAFIHVIHRPNGGLSAARNSGLAIAQGKYVQFVDSDDYLEPNVLDGLVAQMEREELDVLRFDYQNVNEKNEVYQPYKQPHSVDKRTDIVDGETYLNERMGYACYVVMFMIRHEILNNCLFTVGIHFEDVDWTPRMLLAAKRVNSTPTIVYDYLLRKGSITGAVSPSQKKKNIDDSIKVIQLLTNVLSQYPQCVWIKQMKSSMSAGVLTSVARDFWDEYDVYVKLLKATSCFPLIISNQGNTYKRRARIINLSPKLFGCLMHYWYKK